MKALIIEDDSIWQAGITLLLEKIDFEIVGCVDNLPDAKKALAQIKPDIIVADIQLGRSIIFKLYDDKVIYNIPTVFLTVSDNETYFQKVRSIPNSTLLIKPFHKFSLYSAIENLLKKNITETAQINKNDKKDKEIGYLETKQLYQTLGDAKVLDIFNLTPLEREILKRRWQDLETFKDIAIEKNLSAERIRFLYKKTVKKLKSKIVNTSIRYKEYLDFIRINQNKKALFTLQKKQLNGSTESLEPEKIFLDDITEIPTKYKNILKEKGINTLGDITQYSFKELTLIKHLGNGSALEIEKTLSKYNLQLKKN